MPGHSAPGGGATFFLQLEAELIQAHDEGRVKETALLETLQTINLGQPLTWVDLARIFGVDVVFRITSQLRYQGEV